MIAVRKHWPPQFGAVAIAGSVAAAAPVVAWAGPVHAQSSAGFTGFGRGSNGTAALSRARDDARRQIAAARPGPDSEQLPRETTTTSSSTTSPASGRPRASGVHRLTGVDDTGHRFG